jgi:orotidine-5'-phosphate decarboxylase
MKPIFVAIDTPDPARARQIATAVRDHAGGIKLGLEFFSARGPDGVRRIAELGLPIFLDLKFHDIPNTVAKAVEAIAPLEPAILTVHAAGGHEMMLAAKRAAPPATKVVAVTLLTSLDTNDLSDLGIQRSPADQVARLAWIARDSGVDGIVCSGVEVAKAKAAWPNGFLVVPGIRPAGGAAADQKRIVTPAGALDSGASILVIGRPITDAPDPTRAIVDIAAGLSHMPA